MIDFLNGSNGKDHIPCPSCGELAKIKQLISTYQPLEEQNPISSVDLLISEVKMWRAKDTYEQKFKTTMISNIIKKLENQGIQTNENN
jgi:uncharacterized Zn finger protein (UPF0148 family)